MRKIAIIALALFVGLSATAQQPQINNDKAFEISKNLEIFADVYKNLHLNYVDDLESGKLMKRPSTPCSHPSTPTPTTYPSRTSRT